MIRFENLARTTLACLALLAIAPWTPPFASADQACDSQTGELPLPDNVESRQCAASASAALDAAAAEVTDAADCASTCEPNNSQCDRTITVTVGSGGTYFCYPIIVPVGLRPIWCCTVKTGTGGTYNVACDACPER